MADLVTFGETMLRLSVPAGERLELTDDLSIHVGGAESNVAVAAHALGHDAVWTSKLPEGRLGRRVVRALAAYGIETDVAWAEEGRVGTYYYEPGGAPRGADVVYDRAGAAVRTATPAELPVARIEDADAFYVSGITPALSETLAETTASLLDRATESDTHTALDLNYRAKLWSPAEARETLEPLLDRLDTLVVAERDAATVLDRTGDPADVAGALAADHGLETVVVTLGDAGALAWHDGAVHRGPVFEAETVDPVGTGDAFVGGFLSRRLHGGDVPRALAEGAAAASLKRTLAGDVALLTAAEVDAVAEEGADGGISR
jgi:2-dehydro-3-deoxygluconokinase